MSKGQVQKTISSFHQCSIHCEKKPCGVQQKISRDGHAQTTHAIPFSTLASFKVSTT